MAKKTRKAKGKPKQKTSAAGPLVTAVQRGRANALAAYEKLLIDPCNAPLVTPVLGGSSGSYLAKFESYTTVGAVVSGTANTSGFLWWSPGTQSTTAKTCAVDVTSVGGSYTWAAAADGQTYTPGRAFLASTAASYRPVAACMTIMSADPEIRRGGIVAVGCVPNSAVYPNDGNINSLQVLAQNAMRVPDEAIEAVWFPGEGDTLFQDSNSNMTNQQIERKNGLLFAWSNLTDGGAGNPSSVGFRVKLTLIVEWKPALAQGLVQPPVPPQSPYSMGAVMDWVSRNQDVLVRVGGMAAMKYLAYTGGNGGRPRVGWR